MTGHLTGAATATAERDSADQPAGSGGPDTTPGRPANRWTAARQRFGLPVMLIAIVTLGALAVSLLSERKPANSYLDPANSNPGGSHALTDILGERGFQLTGARNPHRALGAVRAASGGVTLVVTSPWLLTRRQLGLLARAGHADLLLVEPGRAALAALAPQVTVHASPAGLDLARPSCPLRAARLAGSVSVGGYTYDVPVTATGCYPVDGYPSLVSYRLAGRSVTVLGSSELLTNAELAANGNAALALNLLSGNHRIVWLTPQPVAHPGRAAGQPSGQQRAAPSLLPAGVSLLLLQLCVVVALTALWRGRRLGPLITERLPVVVRASETVEGHARLYQSRRACGRAATVLRGSVLARLRPAVGLAKQAPADAVVRALAGRSRCSEQEIAELLFGPPPGSESALVELARRLDELEREVRSQ